MLQADDKALREQLREFLGHTLEILACGGNVEEKMDRKRKFIGKLRTSPIAIMTKKANEQHYEVPTRLFEIMLGKRMKYSSCLFLNEGDTLDDAEDNMLDMVCRRCQLRDGMKVMDLGCGWGSTALWILEHYRNCTVTCVSNSNTQRIFIENLAKRRGYDNRIQCVTADANFFDTSERFDRIVSIEMFEHMKNYDLLMTKVSNWLENDGMLFTQILCHREYAYPFTLKQGQQSEWMAENFFSGGTMPSADLFLYFQKDLLIENQWNINGLHYSKTLEAWLQRLDQRREEANAILSSNYGDSRAPTELFNWRKFFIYCSETFGFKGGNEWIVAHHLFSKRPSSKL